MDGIFFILLLILIPMLLILVPIILGYFLYKYLKKNGRSRLGIIIFAGILLFVGYQIYTTFYPDESFYKEDFEFATNIKFPSNAKIIAKSASFPDHFGDYTSLVLVELDSVMRKKIENNLLKNRFSSDDDKIFSDIHEEFIKDNNLEFEKELIKQVDQYYFYVGFIKGENYILVERSSW